MDAKTITCVSAGVALGTISTYIYYNYSHTIRRFVCGKNVLVKTNCAMASTPEANVGSSIIKKQARKASARNFMDDDILKEQLTRNVQFFGEESQQKIADAFVIVVGLGGVGSHAAHLLLRSGVGKLRLVDFDQVTLSSLNRHAVAVRSDVGLSKATCLERHFKEILPESDIEAVVEMFHSGNVDQLLSGAPTFVLDAIDNIDTKVSLVAECVSRNIPVLSVAGAGAKADPTRLKIVDLSETSMDPLARALRQRIRKSHQISSGVPVLLSTEKPRCPLADLEGLVDSLDPIQQQIGSNLATNPLDFQIVPNFRVRTIPVLGTTPAAFGLAAAAYILCTLAEAPFQSEPVFQISRQHYQRQMDRLVQKEETVYGTAPEDVPVDLDAVQFLVRDLWRGISARAGGRPTTPGGDKGLMRSTADLVLTRWDPNRPALADNLILLNFEEAAAHEEEVGRAAGGAEEGGRKQGLTSLREREPEFAKRVEYLLAEATRQFAL